MVDLGEQLRIHIAQGEVAWGTFLVELSCPGAVEIMANCGLDFIIIDGEHGTYSQDQIRRLIDAARLARIPCFVRSGLEDRVSVTKALDAGAAGIFLPMVKTMSDVQVAVEWTKYPPLGRRGVHMFRPHTSFSPPGDKTKYFRKANAAIITAVQIETSEATELVEQIAATDGVDMLYIGPDDLTVSLGCPGQVDHPQVRDVISRVANACRKHGKIAGCHLGKVESAKPLIEGGFSVLGYVAASRMLDDSVRSFVTLARKTAQECKTALSQ